MAGAGEHPVVRSLGPRDEQVQAPKPIVVRVAGEVPPAAVLDQLDVPGIGVGPSREAQRPQGVEAPRRALQLVSRLVDELAIARVEAERRHEGSR